MEFFLTCRDFSISSFFKRLKTHKKILNIRLVQISILHQSQHFVEFISSKKISLPKNKQILYALRTREFSLKIWIFGLAESLRRYSSFVNWVRQNFGNLGWIVRNCSIVRKELPFKRYTKIPSLTCIYTHSTCVSHGLFEVH